MKNSAVEHTRTTGRAKRLNNDAACLAEGDVLGLLNNDLEFKEPRWLEEMVSVTPHGRASAWSARGYCIQMGAFNMAASCSASAVSRAMFIGMFRQVTPVTWGGQCLYELVCGYSGVLCGPQSNF